MKIYLRSLHLEAFRSIRERLEIQFPEKGLLLIRGRNLDTGGSSGAGKTNVFLGISSALGFCPFPGTELQSWDTDEKYRVRLEIGRQDQEPLVVVRSPSGGSVGGEKMAKPATAKLQAYLGGLDAEMLRLLTYAQQDDQQDFLSLDPKGKFDFLSQMFPEIAALEKVGEQASQAAATANAQLLVLKPQMLQLTQRAMNAQAALAQTGGVEALYLEKERLEELVEATKVRKNLAAQAQAQARAEREDRIQVARARVDQVQARNDRIRTEAVQKVNALNLEAQPRIAELQVQISAAQAEVTDHRKCRSPDSRDVKLQDDSHYQQLQEQLRTADLHLAKVTAAYEKARSDATKGRFANALQQGQVRLKIQALETQIREIEEAAKVLPRLTQELARMQENQCPTCSQPWVNATEIDRRKEQVLQLSNSVLKIPALRQEILALQEEDQRLGQPIVEPPVPAQLGRLQEIRTQITEAINETIGTEVARLQMEHRLEWEARSNRLAAVQSQLQALYQDLEQRRDLILAQGQPMAAQIQELETLKRELQAAQAQVVPGYDLQKLEEKLEEAQNLMTDNARAITDKQLREEAAKRDLTQAQGEVTELMTKIEALEHESRLEADIGEVLSRTGFLSALFTEILEEIGLETNKILQQVANTAEVSIRFVSEQENKSGKTVRGIKALVTVRGHEAQLRSGASGGMQTGIRLAVRFAVRAVASRRTGVYPGWVCLDEPFNGLGPVEKETCMEILKLIASEDLVMVVDHGSEFQALFDQEINLVLDKGITRVAP